MSDYSQTLERDTRDLVALARGGTLAAVRFRDAVVDRVQDQLARRRSVLLTGPGGVGKTSVVHALAHRMAEAGGGVYETSTTRIMAGTKYLGEWQSKINALVEQAEAKDGVLYLSDIWNVPTVGRTHNDPSNMLDALGPLIEARQLVLIGEASTDVLRNMERVPGLTKLFEQVVVPPLTEEQARQVVADAGARQGTPLDEAALNCMMALTSRFLPQRHQPGPALTLVDQVAGYHEQKVALGEAEALTPAFIERVFAIYSGLPLFVVSREETRRAGEIRQWFQGRIVGQEQAIEAVVETIALFKAGLHDPTRPIGSFLFVGPTGVGKTEVARVLADYLFGSATRLLRFDMSEFKDYHAFEMLLGDPKDPWRPARLIDPVRAQPFQVVLFDELEKAHSNVWDLFLQLLDEGRMTPPGGAPVNFRNTIVIATSNVGAQGSDRSVGFGATADVADRQEKIRKALENAFRPEFLNRFQHIVVFDPLSSDQLRRVARAELGRILTREGIAGRRIVVDVADEALDQVIESGVDARYGARSLKRELQKRIVLPLAMSLMEREVAAGTIMRVTAPADRIVVKAIDTAESRGTVREKAPVPMPGRKPAGRSEIEEGLQLATERIAAIADSVNEPFLDTERDRLDAVRREPDFYSKPSEVGPLIREMDWATTTLARLDRLRAKADELRESLTGAITRPELERTGRDLVYLEALLAHAWRELVVMGSDGNWDALVEIRPAASARACATRDLLVGTYRKWAAHRGMNVVTLMDPIADDEPVAFGVQGPWAFGLLRLEAGMHRLRDGGESGVCTVTVAAWTDEDGGRPRLISKRAIKATSGQVFGRVKSRIEVEGGLILQNERTVAANTDLARELLGPWRDAPTAPSEIVRRYETQPFSLRDPLTQTRTGNPDTLGAHGFHQLLCLRVAEGASKDQAAPIR
ncbi:MAG: ATP-dependent Clp protease ATP-binding subunit ClpC [Myxococcota bacterium]|jgi:ATP-dependent Clp protease ATP-binding subunit ClpC